MEAMLAKAGGKVAPDANSTLRVTYGQVKGVDAKDGLYYKPQTTLAGIVQKNTGEGDFDAPKAQLDAIQALRAGKKRPSSMRSWATFRSTSCPRWIPPAAIPDPRP